MAKRKTRASKRRPPQPAPPPIPPGATTKASDRDVRPGGPPPSDLGSHHAAGTPGGGTEVGGLGGTNVDEGSPRNADLEETMGTGTHAPEAEDADSGYGGPSGGAVGGSPAGKRSAGGRTHRGIKPGGVHRGDSTIGTNPDSGAE
jgi:hypothetical protein